METHSIKKMKCISNIYGDKRDRTADPLLAGQVLYQLSYTPIKVSRKSFASKIFAVRLPLPLNA